MNHEKIINNIRIQFLSGSLLRIEEKGPNGFEDRSSFNIVNRSLPGISFQESQQDNSITLKAGNYSVTYPDRSSISLSDIEVSSIDRDRNFKIELDEFNNLEIVLCEAPKDIYYKFAIEAQNTSTNRYRMSSDARKYTKEPSFCFLPFPSSKHMAWVMGDHPRIIPPEWGLTPPPDEYADDPNSGWDISNSSNDLYFFIPEKGDCQQIVSDILTLTGKTPMPPKYAFGHMDSRYYPYSDKKILKLLDIYEQKQIPLDLFVIDTDWRISGSHGYEVDTRYFPDMKKFFQECKTRNIKTMFNDHIVNYVENNSLAPEEFQQHYDNMTGILDMGLSAWWYDRNWMHILKQPAPGFRYDLWGMALVWDITARYRPQERPFMMSNAVYITDTHSIGNPCNVVQHRYPIHWDGDTSCGWDVLCWEIQRSVVHSHGSMLAFLGTDIGSHLPIFPDPENYIRFMQFGSFSPTLRPHLNCSSVVHYPFGYDEETEDIVSNYIKLRYRLFPYLYSCVRETHESGMPIVRRCDFRWPGYKDSSSNKQYLFGSSILVAPVFTNGLPEINPVPPQFLSQSDGSAGMKFIVKDQYTGKTVFTQSVSNIEGEKEISLWETATTPELKYDGDKYNISIEGEIGPVEKAGTYLLSFVPYWRANIDRTRVYFNNELVIDDDFITNPMFSVDLKQGETCDIRIENIKDLRPFKTMPFLFWRLPAEDVSARRNLWLPPGEWTDPFSGKTYTGPQQLTMAVPLAQMPLFVKNNEPIISSPQTRNLDESNWDTVVIDTFVSNEKHSCSQLLYEDDGSSISYKETGYRKTNINFYSDSKEYKLLIDKAEGSYENNCQSRDWVIRFHLNKDFKEIPCFNINGKQVSNEVVSYLEPGKDSGTTIFMGQGSAPAPEQKVCVEINLININCSEPIEITFEKYL